jgi:hypothetical protein
VEELFLNDVRQIAIHTAETLVPDPSPFEFQIAIAILERYKSPGSDQILAELIQAEVKDHPVQKYPTLGQEKRSAQFLIPFKVGPL